MRTIAIAAGKGGVGKSLVTVNLARALMRQGWKVGILDADLYGPSVRKMLHEDEVPSRQGERLMPAICEGIAVLSLAYFRAAGDAVAVRAPIANAMIQQLLQADWGALDCLLVDLPPGTGDIALTLTQKCSLTGAVMVTTPQELALLDVRRAANLFFQVNVPLLGVVENMSYYRQTSGEEVALFGSGGGQTLATEWQVPLLGSIPLDPEFSRCADTGGDPFSSQTYSEGCQVLMSIAKQIQECTQEAPSEDSLELAWKEMRT